MKTFLITCNNNTLFRLVINLSRENAASTDSGAIISEYDRHWFDNALLAAVYKVDKVLMPIAQSPGNLKQTEICFTVSQPQNTSLEILADLIEKSLITAVYRQWCGRCGFSCDGEESLCELKRVVLGVGGKFKRKNEK